MLSYNETGRGDRSAPSIMNALSGRVQVEEGEFKLQKGRPVFTDWTALHGQYPGIEASAMEAFHFIRNEDCEETRYIKMRTPREMRQLAGTAELITLRGSTSGQESPD